MATDSKQQEWKQISDEEWKNRLTPQEYEVCRKKGTERPWTGEYNKFYEPGEYTCTCCGAKLFVSDDKFDSGCGWPAFDRPADKAVVAEHSDLSHGMVRTEVTCSSCGAHLGHVFNDGPKKTTGMRYCINSVSLKYKKPAK